MMEPLHATASSAGGKHTGWITPKDKRLTAVLLAGTVCLFIISVVFRQYIRLWSALSFNVVLAALPLLFSLLYVVSMAKAKSRALLILWAFLWLITLPNAPYMFTDFIHTTLYKYPYGQATLPAITPWLALSHILLSVVIGSLYGYLSLYLMHTAIRQRYNTALAWVFNGMVSLLCGVGIYLGRFMRFHSIDLLRRPWLIFQQIAQQLGMRMAVLSLLFAAITWGGFLLFYTCYHCGTLSPNHQ